mmetsp:Transcript_43910/g.111056  ORF Transcript_43910/g.111056 Transcript_43910/m.111056 type:complete len:230 (-) Transcript_43910:419-1108(-)
MAPLRLHPPQGVDEFAAVDAEQRRVGADGDDVARVVRLALEAALSEEEKAAGALLDEALDLPVLAYARDLPNLDDRDGVDGLAMRGHHHTLAAVFALKLVDDHLQEVVGQGGQLRQRLHHRRHGVVVQHPAQQRVVQLQEVLPHHDNRRDRSSGEAVRAAQLAGDQRALAHKVPAPERVDVQRLARWQRHVDVHHAVSDEEQLVPPLAVLDERLAVLIRLLCHALRHVK